MKNDVERWNRKYAAKVGEPLPEPDTVLVKQSLPNAGLALDVACGHGANTAYLATLGYSVLGVDCSIVALRQARTLITSPGVTFIVADLDVWPLREGLFDLVVVTRFLNRALIANIRSAVKPGGLIFYRTFNRCHLEHAPRFNASFVLADGELERLFEGFQPLTSSCTNSGDSQSYLLARRPEACWAR